MCLIEGGGLNKYLHLKRGGDYLRGGLNREDTVMQYVILVYGTFRYRI